MRRPVLSVAEGLAAAFQRGSKLPHSKNTRSLFLETVLLIRAIPPTLTLPRPP